MANQLPHNNQQVANQQQQPNLGNPPQPVLANQNQAIPANQLPAPIPANHQPQGPPGVNQIETRDSGTQMEKDEEKEEIIQKALDKQITPEVYLRRYKRRYPEYREETETIANPSDDSQGEQNPSERAETDTTVSTLPEAEAGTSRNVCSPERTKKKGRLVTKSLKIPISKTSELSSKEEPFGAACSAVREVYDPFPTVVRKKPKDGQGKLWNADDHNEGKPYPASEVMEQMLDLGITPEEFRKALIEAEMKQTTDKFGKLSLKKIN